MKSQSIKKLVIFSVIFIIVGSSFSSSVTSSKSDKSKFDVTFDTKVKILLKVINVPSATICLIKNNSVKVFKNYGYKELYKRERATNDTIYCLGSVSKTVTAVALMQLHDEGHFELDDDISEYLPFEVKNPRYPDTNITFRMIMAHQAGFNDFGLKLRKLPYMLFHSRLKDNSDQLIEDMLSSEGKAYSKRFYSLFEPGSRALYCELGFILAGRLIEEISGFTVEEYCQENIFQPLGMVDTSFNPETLDQQRIARPYVNAFQINTPLPKYDLFLLDAPAGLWTTGEDFTRFFIALMNGGVYNGTRILEEDTIDLMHTRQYPESNDNLLGLLFRRKIEVQHGLGWFFIDVFDLELEGHTGGAPGYSCHMYITKNDNNEKVGIIVLGNGPMLFPAALSSRLVIKGYESFLKLLIEKTEELEV